MPRTLVTAPWPGTRKSFRCARWTASPTAGRASERSRARVEPFVEQAGPVPLQKLCAASDLTCKRPTRGAQYAFSLHGRTLSAGAQRYEYFDAAKATHSSLYMR